MHQVVLRVLLRVGLLSLAPALAWAAESGADQATAPAQAEELTFREPFTLKLRVDKEHYYEEKLDRKIPFVADNTVYLFSGDSFGLSLSVENGEIVAVAYQKAKAGADIEVEFNQDDDDATMMLTLKSNIKQVLYLDALMTVPGKKKIRKTSVLPLQPGLGGYELWPHPIVQLILTNLRFKEEISTPAPQRQSNRTDSME